ncbi:hypothetical protein A0H81_00413 [Grifola frondosa]|uniref:DUF6533 domain-containing protein n=1 Tax=Grifola frondosa TaxID=5627 RepID=A0A1C7MR25_GRIFR|nr:hypothetical protein A0H81_00413 [Grifola frondosa]
MTFHFLEFKRRTLTSGPFQTGIYDSETLEFFTTEKGCWKAHMPDPFYGIVSELKGTNSFERFGSPSPSHPAHINWRMDIYIDNAVVIQNCCVIASSAVLFFDFLVTIGLEVRFIWGRKFTGATVVYFINRYATLAERIILIILSLLPTTGNAVPKSSSIMSPSTDPSSCYRVPIFASSSAIATEIFLIAFTWIQTFGVLRSGIKMPIVTLLLRDGWTLFFVSILLVQICIIISLTISSFIPDAVVTSLSYLDDVSSSIFASRFMLNLRAVYYTEADDPSRCASASNLRFDIVGNLGVPLELEWDVMGTGGRL